MKLKYWAYLVSGLVAFSFPLSMAVLVLTGFFMVVLANLASFVVGSISAAVIFGVVRAIIGEEK